MYLLVIATNIAVLLMTAFESYFSKCIKTTHVTLLDGTGNLSNQRIDLVHRV